MIVVGPVGLRTKYRCEDSASSRVQFLQERQLLSRRPLGWRRFGIGLPDSFDSGCFAALGAGIRACLRFGSVCAGIARPGSSV